MDRNSNVALFQKDLKNSSERNIGHVEEVLVLNEDGQKMGDLHKVAGSGGKQTGVFSVADCLDGNYRVSESEQETGIKTTTDAQGEQDPTLIGLSPSIAGHSEYHIDLEDSTGEQTVEMSVFSPSLESSMTHKHMLRHKSLPDALNSEGRNKMSVPHGQSFDAPNVPEIAVVEEPNLENHVQSTLEKLGNKSESSHNTDTELSDDNIEIEEDRKILFETASMLLKAPELSNNLSPIGILRKQQRSFSESGVDSPDPGVNQPKIFLTKKTKKLVIKLPSGDLLKGR